LKNPVDARDGEAMLSMGLMAAIPLAREAVFRNSLLLNM
jgi:hypothetical protein